MYYSLTLENIPFLFQFTQEIPIFYLFYFNKWLFQIKTFELIRWATSADYIGNMSNKTPGTTF